MNNVKNLIPHNLMRQIGIGHKDNREVVIDYLVGQEGSVQLTAEQKELMGRWSMADNLMRKHTYTQTDIANALKNHFGYSIATAKRDVEDAKFVFGSSSKSNKKYLLALHIDRMEKAVVLMQKQGRLDLLPKLYDSMTRAILALPEEKKEENLPSAIMFQFTQNVFNNLSPVDITPLDAKETAVHELVRLGLGIDDLFNEEEDGE